MKKKIVLTVLSLMLFGCASMMFGPRPDLTHTYELVVVDVSNAPLEGAEVDYTLKNLDTVVTDTTVLTDSSGKVIISALATVDTRYEAFKIYKTEFFYTVSKEGYYSQSDAMSSRFGEYNNEKAYNAKTVRLIQPTDYIAPSLFASKESHSINSNILKLIDELLKQCQQANVNLEAQSIDLRSFKGKAYLSFVFNSTTSYNSLRLNKYEIAKTLFDEVIRKTLNPLTDRFAVTEEFYGYDLTVIGHTKAFTDTYAPDQAVAYRFLMPKNFVNNYKQKDISGQQLLDSSVILMNDERIDLKLQ